MVQIWQEDSDNKQPLRPIIPLVLYHGQSKWPIGTNFTVLFEGPSSLKRYWPSFDYQLYDLSQYDDEQLQGLAQTKMILLLLKHIRDQDLIEQLPAILRLFEQLANVENGLEYLHTVLNYIAAAAPTVSAPALRLVLQEVVDQEGESIMTTLAQQWFEEGKREGKAEGRQEGREEGREEGMIKGRQDLLLLLMRQKFGPLPAAWERRLRAVEDPARLAALAEQLLTAENLAELEF